MLPYADAVARANFHTQRLILPEVSSVTLQYMQCVLPPPAQALQLLYAAALMCGIRDAELKDDCGDISWDKVKAVSAITITIAYAYMHVLFVLSLNV